jgi:hypothetical protein
VSGLCLVRCHGRADGCAASPGLILGAPPRRVAAADQGARDASGRPSKLLAEQEPYEAATSNARHKCLGGDPGAVAAAKAGLAVLEPFLSQAHAGVRRYEEAASYAWKEAAKLWQEAKDFAAKDASTYGTEKGIREVGAPERAKRRELPDLVGVV